jgi:glycosyltransferase involved in cell wall biosynthesis
MSHRISVAFSNMIHPGWLAGGQYLYNLLFANKASGLPIETILRVTPGTPSQSYAMLNGLYDRIIELSLNEPVWPETFPNRIKRLLKEIFLDEDRKFAKNHIDAQFILLNPIRALHTPTITWIPDFQYLHIPAFFPEQELAFRAKFYPATALNSTSVALSSQNALDDLRRVAPAAVGKAHVLNFVAQVDPSLYKADPELIAQHYHLPEKFFFLPNQFWQHKNHEVVIKALALAKKESSELMVVCTGGVYDHRKPEYFDNILQQIAIHGLQENICVLGRIPREHFWQLMRRSVAMLQPSLFEGWSTSVEEVKSLGKSIIISDIPVHREQNPSSALYFDPHDPVLLAQYLLKTQKEKSPGPELELEQLAREQLPERTRTFAHTFYEIIIGITQGKKDEKSN